MTKQSRSITLALFLVGAAGCDGDGVGPDGGSRALCLNTVTLDRLRSHLAQMRFAAALLAGHPGALEANGFFLFPGLHVQRVAVFAGPLAAVCSEPLQYDEYCEEDGLCSFIKCTGVGASWEMHFRLQMPVSSEIRYGSATVDTAWADGDDGFSFVLGSSAADGGVDWSLAGSGRMDTESLELTETYAAIASGRAATFSVTDTLAGGHAGSVRVQGVEVARVDPATGDLNGAGDCR